MKELMLRKREIGKNGNYVSCCSSCAYIGRNNRFIVNYCQKDS